MIVPQSKSSPEQRRASPPAQQPSPASPTGAGAGGSRRQLRILIVDDDWHCLSSVKEALAPEGHDVYTASSGLEALDFTRQLRLALKAPDVSILDFHMPDLTGVETFRRLQCEAPLLQAIFVSGNATTTLEDEVRLAGGRALFLKPLDVLRLRSSIREIALEGPLGTGPVAF